MDRMAVRYGQWPSSLFWDLGPFAGYTLNLRSCAVGEEADAAARKAAVAETKRGR